MKVTENASALIDYYIDNLPSFSKEICERIRTLIHQSNTNVIEDWKWKIPIFCNSDKVCGFAAFKNHVSLTFFKGAEMSDKHQLFSDDCSAQFTRVIKFNNISEIKENQLVEYFNEAFSIENKPTKTSIKKEIEIPELLQNALKNNRIAKANFENMAYTYRKEYARHINEAKREETKLKRLKQVIFNLENNIKMHEQYKKC
ncbi:YdeI/OmpD-associated family protein [Lutibacter sp. B1]|uniref:YdeI/OmpD-associated family protein n=1 Tax=Lutibacter sp. B1 TaxID=2725996 RepID=UPI001456CDC5|nr:YdeI/OmpD-associated family protein [Lutibacter sp. B1]NLP58465.1 hypothetical protein [Lutibacter sp. B1]